MLYPRTRKIFKEFECWLSNHCCCPHPFESTCIPTLELIIFFLLLFYPGWRWGGIKSNERAPTEVTPLKLQQHTSSILQSTSFERFLSNQKPVVTVRLLWNILLKSGDLERSINCQKVDKETNKTLISLLWNVEQLFANTINTKKLISYKIEEFFEYCTLGYLKFLFKWLNSVWILDNGEF